MNATKTVSLLARRAVVHAKAIKPVRGGEYFFLFSMQYAISISVLAGGGSLHEYAWRVSGVPVSMGLSKHYEWV